MKGLLCILLLLSATSASAAERYFSLSAGPWFPGKSTTTGYNLKPLDTSYSTGFSIGGAVGVSLDNGFRIENELIYRQASSSGPGGGVDQWNLGWLLNFWYDVKNSSRFTPYVGGGFGYGRGQNSSPGMTDESGYGVAYQAGGGCDVKLAEKLSLDLGYRCFGITSTFGGPDNYNPSGSSATAGLRMRF